MEQQSPRTRWFVLTGLAVLWVGVLTGRLAYLQLFRYGYYLSKAQQQQQRVFEITPPRGVIYDRNGHELALSTPVDSCFADPGEISNPAMVARLLSRVLAVPAEELEKKLREPKSFVWIARKVSPEVAARIQALNLTGIYFQKENRRFYPQRRLAAQVLGNVDLDEHGQSGIELVLDKDIRGRSGHVLVTEDGRRRWRDRRETAADAGAQVILTLDETIQFIAEKELAAAIAATRAKSGVVLVQDPATGELLGLANWPTFDPNEASSASDEAKMDRAVEAAYEPGSTFKLITLAGALAEGITTPSELVDCQMGTILVSGRLIHDWHPFGLLTVADVLARSSDVGAIKVGLRLGAPKLYQYIRAFGFGQPTGIELPGENHGLLRHVENWTASSIGSLAMGQEVSVTPVQLITAVSSIANGGLLCRPHVVSKIAWGPDVRALPEPSPRRSIDAPTAATLRHMMEGVVLQGTGKPAAVSGYSVAGKTGTAQKIDPFTGRYSPSQYVASFVGFAPVNNPALTILVVLDSPLGPHHGGEVAGPVFRRIAEQVLAYLGVPRDAPVLPELETTSLHGNGQSEPRHSADFAGLNSPEEKEELAEIDSSAPTVALGEGRGIVVPDFTGASVRAVSESCARLGLPPVLVGSGIAVEQKPEGGVRVPRGSRVLVRFERSSRVVQVGGRSSN